MPVFESRIDQSLTSSLTFQYDAPVELFFSVHEKGLFSHQYVRLTYITEGGGELSPIEFRSFIVELFTDETGMKNVLSIKPELEDHQRQGYRSLSYFVTLMKMKDVIYYAENLMLARPRYNYLFNNCRHYAESFFQKLKSESKTIALPFSPDYMDAYFKKFPRQKAQTSDGSVKFLPTVSYLSFSKLVQRFPRESLETTGRKFSSTSPDKRTPVQTPDKKEEKYEQVSAEGQKALAAILSALANFRDENEYKELPELLDDKTSTEDPVEFAKKAKKTLELAKFIQKNGSKTPEQKKALEEMSSHIAALEDYLAK